MPLNREYYRGLIEKLAKHRPWSVIRPELDENRSVCLCTELEGGHSVDGGILIGPDITESQIESILDGFGV